MLYAVGQTLVARGGVVKHSLSFIRDCLIIEYPVHTLVVREGAFFFFFFFNVQGTG